MDTETAARPRILSPWTCLVALLCFGSQACQHRIPLVEEDLQKVHGAGTEADPPDAGLEGRQLRAALLSEDALRVEEGGPLRSERAEPLVLTGLPLESQPGVVHADLALGDGPAFLHRGYGGGGRGGEGLLVGALIVAGAVLLVGFAYLHSLGSNCTSVGDHGRC
jgi:hypothetical protein